MCGDILSIDTRQARIENDCQTRRVPLGKETRHKEKKGKLPVEGALVHEAAHAPASELALAGWLAGEGHACAIAELNWGCWVGLGLGGGAVQTPPRARAPRR